MRFYTMSYRRGFFFIICIVPYDYLRKSRIACMSDEVIGLHRCKFEPHKWFSPWFFLSGGRGCSLMMLDY